MSQECSVRRVSSSDGEVILFLHTDRQFPLSDWSFAFDEIREAERNCGKDLARFRIMPITDGGAPNTPMRAQLTEWLGGRAVPIAVLTNSTLARGVVTAISWFNPKIRAFAPNRWRDAAEHVALTASEEKLILGALDEMDKELRRPSEVLAEIRAHHGRS